MPPFSGPEKNFESKSPEETSPIIDTMLDNCKKEVPLSDKSNNVDTLKTIEQAQDHVKKLINEVEAKLDENAGEKERAEAKLTEVEETCNALKKRLEKTDKTTVEAKLYYRFLHYLGRKENELKEMLGQKTGPKAKNVMSQNQKRETKVPQ